MVVEKIVSFLSYIFCLIVLLDPTNSVLGLKVPFFGLFIFCMALSSKPQLKDFPLICLIIVLHIVSYMCGIVQGNIIDDAMTIQYGLFFVTLFGVMWSYKMDFHKPIIFGCVFVSFITIIGSVSMSFFPDLTTLIYSFSQDHDDMIIMAKRQFLGIEINTFLFKSLPVVVIPATYYFKKFLDCRENRINYLLVSSFFILALMCGGNRTLIFGPIIIIMFSSYSKFKNNKLFRLCLFVISIVTLWIIMMALFEKGEASTDIKMGHLQSYYTLLQNKWYNILWGMGCGSYFYTFGEMQQMNNTEWTYLELIRTNGLVGTSLFLLFLLKPLIGFKDKAKRIINWAPTIFGYILFLIMSGSNPFLISSTGLLYILYIYSYERNLKYRNL